MRVFSFELPDKPLTNFKLPAYAQELGIPYFRGVFRRDALPKQTPHSAECGIVNLNTPSQSASHWVCYYRNKSSRIYFDSFGQITPVEIQRYLKTGTKFVRGREIIQRNTDIVQAVNTELCVHLCLFVLKLWEWIYIRLYLYFCSGLKQSYWKDTIQTEEGFCFTEASPCRTLQSLAFTTGFKRSPTARAGAIQCSRCNRYAS